MDYLDYKKNKIVLLDGKTYVKLEQRHSLQQVYTKTTTGQTQLVFWYQLSEPENLDSYYEERTKELIGETVHPGDREYLAGIVRSLLEEMHTHG